MAPEPLDAKWQLENRSCWIEHATLGERVRTHARVQYHTNTVDGFSDAVFVQRALVVWLFSVLF